MSIEASSSVTRGPHAAARWVAAAALVLYLSGGPVGAIFGVGPSLGAQPVLLAVLVAAGFLVVVSQRGGLFFPPDTRWIYAWLGFAALSLQWTTTFGGGLGLYAYRLYVVIPAVLFALNIAFNVRAAHVYCWSFLGALLFAFAHALQNGLVIGRLTLYETYNPTWFAGYVAIGVFVAAWLISRYRSSVVRLVLVMLIGVLLVALVLAQARNSLVAVGTAFILTMLLRTGRKLVRGYSSSPQRILTAAGTLVILATTSFLVFRRGLEALGLSIADLYRVRALASFGDFGVMTAGRNVIWSNAVAMFDQPLVGSGFGSFAFEYQRAFGRYTQPHNVYLGTMFELGAVGIVLLAGLWVALTVYVLRKDRRHGVPTAMLFYLLLFALGNDALGYKHFWVGWVFLHIFLMSGPSRSNVSAVDAHV
jgi:O-antigen ligase